jgi:hypothetical protein
MRSLVKYHTYDEKFRLHKEALWGCLSRQNNVLIVANISLFFVSGLIAKGYFYTFISLGLLGFSGVLMIFPVLSYSRLWYYLVAILFHLAGMYFLVSSVFYWINTLK